jgi:hypothetical protein
MIRSLLGPSAGRPRAHDAITAIAITFDGHIRSVATILMDIKPDNSAFGDEFLSSVVLRRSGGSWPDA